MKIIKLDDIEGTDKQVYCPKGDFVSNRFLLESDGMGYTITKTIIKKGASAIWHYKNHLESCYCIEGFGIVRAIDDGKEWKEIEKDTMYVLDKHDKHEFFAIEETHLICVFNPPLKGKEVHNENGVYES